MFSFSLFSQNLFDDITFPSNTGYVYNESGWFGGGVSMIDFDKDGHIDILASTYFGEPIKIFRNNEDNTFIELSNNIGFTSEFAESKMILGADYDNDGDRDFFIANVELTSKLYNNNGDNYFYDVTDDAGFSMVGYSSRAACWFDYNNDSYLDLYITNNEYYEPNIFYKNNGDGTFENLTEEANLSGNEQKAPLAVVAFDYNNDGYVDIYIGNDKNEGNNLYRNNGDGTFSDVSESSGSGIFIESMGVSVADYNNDGWFDIYITNTVQGNVLLKNNGGSFVDVSDEAGVKGNKVFWGTIFIDYDNDGYEDIFACSACDVPMYCNGNGPDDINMLFQNNGDGTFTDKTFVSGILDNYKSYGVARGDVNNDGFDDIYIVNEVQLSQLYLNNTNDNQMVKIHLEGIYSNKDGIGSKIEVFSNNSYQIKAVRSGSSMSSQNSLEIIFGLSDQEMIDSLVVYWPSRMIDKFYSIDSGQTLNILEGNGENNMGDINGDGSIDVFDILLIVEFILGSIPNDQELISSDCNDDGSIDIFDVILLVEIILLG